MNFTDFKKTILDKDNEAFDGSDVVVLINGQEYKVEDIQVIRSFLLGRKVIITTEEDRIE